MTQRFQATTVVVTGGSRGLGRAIALAFGREGAFVYLGYHRSHNDAKSALAALVEQGSAGALLQLDVRDAADVTRAIGEVLAARGAIDVLVNNAGVLHQGLFALGSGRDDDELLAVNLHGVMHGCRAVLRAMIGRRQGSIINVASVAGIRPRAGLASYAASKGGVLALTRALALEVAAKGVRVNAVVPGYLSAGMGARISPQLASERTQSIPMGRFGQAQELANAVVFLASAEASYITGQALVVDGGLSL